MTITSVSYQAGGEGSDIQLLAAARAEGLAVENPADIGRMLCGS